MENIHKLLGQYMPFDKMPKEQVDSDSNHISQCKEDLKVIIKELEKRQFEIREKKDQLKKKPGFTSSEEDQKEFQKLMDESDKLYRETCKMDTLEYKLDWCWDGIQLWKNYADEAEKEEEEKDNTEDEEEEDSEDEDQDEASPSKKQKTIV